MAESTTLTSALEDYLETIYELVRDNKFARVKDIAKARGVKSGSVTPAMKRLADLGLIKYVQREYIDLTESGEVEARRIYAKHQILTRFFEEFLGMAPAAANADACAMEHSLSEKGMDHLTRFFEYLRVCPKGQSFSKRFQQCPITHGEELDCASCSHADEACCEDERGQAKSIAEMKPGDQARVTQVNGTGAIRQRMLDMGILPDTLIEVARIAPAGDPIWIKIQGFQLSLHQNEAKTVLVKSTRASVDRG
jgi:DtxR family Mn-dependent transcriptional regulator